ncbi:unnamed protein product [Linum trigynum]|uniref:Uncharacterized protein n=1 Tax=Linum trigynum TaxID=586398 RepID=A0AAV2F9M8_9ROSI
MTGFSAGTLMYRNMLATGEFAAAIVRLPLVLRLPLQHVQDYPTFVPRSYSSIPSHPIRNRKSAEALAGLYLKYNHPSSS